MFESIDLIDAATLVSCIAVVCLLARIAGALERLNTREHMNKIRDDALAENLRSRRRSHTF